MQSNIRLMRFCLLGVTTVVSSACIFSPTQLQNAALSNGLHSLVLIVCNEGNELRDKCKLYYIFLQKVALLKEAKGLSGQYQTMGNWTMLNTSQLLLNATQVPTEKEFLVSSIPVLTIVRITLCSIRILCNYLVVFVVIKGFLRKSVFMNLLLILAIFDSLYLIASLNTRKEIFGRTLVGSSTLHCSLTRFLLTISGPVSSWVTVLISLERFIAIYYLFKVHIYCTKKRLYMIIVTMTVCASVGAIPTFFISAVVSSGDSYDCQFVFTSGLVLAYRIIILTFYSIVPSFIIATFSISMIKKLRIQSSLRMKYQGRQCTHSSSTKNKSQFVMMVSVCLVFVVTSFPCTIVIIVTYSSCFSQGVVCMIARGWQFQLAYMLEDMNHSLNLFLYCLAGSVFRHALFQLFPCKRT